MCLTRDISHEGTPRKLRPPGRPQISAETPVALLLLLLLLLLLILLLLLLLMLLRRRRQVEDARGLATYCLDGCDWQSVFSMMPGVRSPRFRASLQLHPPGASYYFASSVQGSILVSYRAAESKQLRLAHEHFIMKGLTLAL